jgi:hypothetical protein
VKRLLSRIWRPRPRTLATRTDLLNFLASEYGYERYLEIGVRVPSANFGRVRASLKHGVDPGAHGRVSHPMTSDAFFARLARAEQPTKYDLIMIDGLHLAEQVERDVINSLANLSPEGCIVLHDCNPLTEDAQTVDYDGRKTWNGTVWKAWVKLRATRPDLSMRVVDMDHGCGVIRPGSQDTYEAPTLDYAAMDYTFLERNRINALNLVSPAEFERMERNRCASSKRA